VHQFSALHIRTNIAIKILTLIVAVVAASQDIGAVFTIGMARASCRVSKIKLTDGLADFTLGTGFVVCAVRNCSFCFHV
jgi:hypothetical protein